MPFSHNEIQEGYSAYAAISWPSTYVRSPPDVPYTPGQPRFASQIESVSVRSMGRCWSNWKDGLPRCISDRFHLRGGLLVITLKPCVKAIWRHQSLPPHGYGTNFALISWTDFTGSVQIRFKAEDRREVLLAYRRFTLEIYIDQNNRHTSIIEGICVGCGMHNNSWSANNAIGYLKGEEMYCCQDCAEGIECIRNQQLIIYLKL